MRYKILKDGEIINTIVADESFATDYCEKNGYTYEIIQETEHEPKSETPSPAKQREEAYNTQAIIPWDGEMLTVTQASQKWQYYAAEGNTEKTDKLTALIAEAKASIREQYPDEEANV